MTGKTKIVSAATLASMLLGAWWALVPLSAQNFAVEAAAPDMAPVSGSEIIKGYRQWTRVNPVPAVFHSQIARQCAPPTARQSRMEAGNPHRHKFITVYVNNIGRHAMMQEKVPRFPQGSVIVKEKLPAEDSTKPELLTVMTKREPGYNPQNGDWEYMALDGSGESVQARGRLESCQGCHMMVKATDYVSRYYLPSQVREKLK